MSVNSSGSVERFTLGAGESKIFENIDTGSNAWVVDVHGEVVRNMDGTLGATVDAPVALQGDNGGTFASPTGVASATIKSGGFATLTGNVSAKYARIINTGPGIVYVVAKSMR